MSIVIGLRYKDGIAYAADTQVSYGNIKEDNMIKISQGLHSNTCMGVVGYMRDANIIYAHDDFIGWEDLWSKTKIDLKYVVKNIVPDLFKLLRSNNRVKNKDGIEKLCSAFMFGTSTGIYTIDTDGCAKSYRNWAALGSGEQLVQGYLNTLKDDFDNITEQRATEILKAAIELACKDEAYINNKIDFIYLEREK